MSVTLFEENVTRMLQSEVGPVGVFLHAVTDAATHRAQDRAAQIMHRFPGGGGRLVEGKVFEGPLRGEVGMFESGPASQYLKRKELREKWLERAVFERA